MVPFSSLVQRGVAKIVCRIDVSAFLNQGIDHVNMVILSSLVQRGVAPAIFSATDVKTVILETAPSF
jgi:hypothetical protein